MFLVRNDKAQSFLTALGTNTGRKVALGDFERLERVKPNVQGMHLRAKETYEKLRLLHFDQTRKTVDKHVAARTLATQLVQAATNTRNEIVAQSNALSESGQRAADETFAPVGDRATYDAKTLDWIKETAAQPDGISKIKAEANKSIAVASVLYNSPHFLTGLAEQVHSNMRLSAVEKYAPKAYAELQESVELSGLVPKYDKFAANVHSSFYTPAIAEQADTRVDIEA
ncbi:MAG: hypothetical protein AAF092_15940 [Pseudomonadota bacterium]